MANRQKTKITIHSSAAEYLTFAAATGDSKSSYEMRYEDENIWLTQKMMAALENPHKSFLHSFEKSFLIPPKSYVVSCRK